MEHFDVIIVGAGVSGIGAACHLRAKCPDRTFAILEGRDAIGGTWDLFRYPGIRSDSDMHTFGYSFKPWKSEKSIADGDSILSYLEETVTEHDVIPHVRFQHHVTRASWSTGESSWTVEAEQLEDGEDARFTCNFLFMCSGYYSYAGGYTPDFAGIERFGGPVVHPQAWPEDLDYAGKRVAVIGSGATAMTLVPAMAEKAARVTMIQRSPTYVISLPARDAIANRLRRLLPEKLAYAITRWKNVLMQRYLYRTTRVKPEKIKRLLLDAARKQLGDEYVNKHFTPTYNPWDQRLCLIPDGDLFRAISSGKAEVVTDTIAGFDNDCVRLSSGTGRAGRYPGDRDRLEPRGDGRHRDQRRWRTGPVFGHPLLQGHDVRGRAQSRQCLRLRERFLDPAGGSHLRIRLPRAQSHDGDGHASMHAAPA